MSDLVESCKEFVRRIVGCLIEFGGGGEAFGVSYENCEVSDLIGSCMEFVRVIARCLIGLGKD